MYQVLFLFFIYAFLGWCTEVCYVTLLKGEFVNRGFLNGPLCPIYGFGAVLVLSLLLPLRESKLLLFLCGTLLTSALEWLTGFLLEKLFHQRWWDYSDEPFNLGGYVCLRFSLGWGAACLFVVYLLHPTVELVIHLLPRPVGTVLLCALMVAMAADLAATVNTITKFNRRLSQIDELAAKMRELSDEIGENLADKVLDAAEKGADWKEELEDRTELLRSRAEELREEVQTWKDSAQFRRAARQEELEQLRKRLEETMNSKGFGQERLLRAFPKLRSLDHKQALEDLRRRLKDS